MRGHINWNPILIGLVIIVISLFDLCILIFRFEGYQKFVRRHLWFRVLSKYDEAVSREARIAGSIFFLLAGLMQIAADLRWFSPTFRMTVAAAPFVVAIVLTLRDKWRKRKLSREKTSSRDRTQH
jgi:hypothetical protein